MKKILSIALIASVLTSGAFAADRDANYKDFIPTVVSGALGGLIGGPVGLGFGIFIGGFQSLISVNQDKTTVDSLVELSQH